MSKPRPAAKFAARAPAKGAIEADLTHPQLSTGSDPAPGSRENSSEDADPDADLEVAVAMDDERDQGGRQEGRNECCQHQQCRTTASHSLPRLRKITSSARIVTMIG